MAYACYHCGKQIKGAMHVHVPNRALVIMGLDFERTYHPKCYKLAEAEAAALIADVTGPPKENRSVQERTGPNLP